MRRLLKGLCVIVVLLSVPAKPVPVSPNFSGVVRDAAQGGLFGATIVVQYWERDRASGHVQVISRTPIYTDDEGRFSTYLAPGLYDVFISHPVMDPIAKKIMIPPAKPIRLDCELRLSPLVSTAVGLEVR
jgi:hypothetical protein